MEETQKTSKEICGSCGGEMVFEPGTSHLKCNYCSDTEAIEAKAADVVMSDFFKTDHEQDSEKITLQTVKCDSCGAESSVDQSLASTSCAYCAAPLKIENALEQQLIKPQSLLPFKIKQNESGNILGKWVNSRWFAPNNFKKAALKTDSIKSIYMPFWGFDVESRTDYWGERGTTRTTGSGEDRKTETSWSNTSGSVRSSFDNLLVPASKSLPTEMLYELEPWDVKELVEFDEKFLTGHITEKYQIDVKGGFGIAEGIMNEKIDSQIRSDIGGDRQRINSKNTKYESAEFHHVLMPVYISSYNYDNKVYRFVINARTGEIQGERPWSAIKIALAIIGAAIIIGTIWYFNK